MPDPRTLQARWPRLTLDVPPVPFTIRRSWDDFVVREIPLHEPTGDGDHALLEVEKRGVSTAAAVRDLSRALGVRPSDVGVAGLKDTRAVTVQRVSVEHVDPGAALALELPRVRVTNAWRTRRKLRTGHLAGNAFELKLRGEAAADVRLRLPDMRAVLPVLTERGIPNYFGAQRFGMRADNHRVGRALLAGDFAEAAALIAGRPEPGDAGDMLRARELFDAGRFAEAAGAWPRGNAEAARVARAKASGRDDRGAVMATGKKLLRFYVSALQSALFNDVLAARVGSLDALEAGDVAWVHEGERVFLVEDPAGDTAPGDPAGASVAELAARGEISPTGPLFGPRMKEPAGAQAAREAAVLEGAGLAAGDFGRRGPWGTPGGRRPLRVPGVTFDVDAGEDETGPYVRLAFSLPPGAYATAVLRELAKGHMHVGTAREWEAGR
ncbi:MAG: tRNA pseudouridine(13) synthase TruD, partial [Gemmatimonadota bacterium]